jgi:hypothetical protein
MAFQALAIPALATAGKALFGQGARMAASNLFKKALFGGMTKGQIAGRLAPDAIFGGMAAIQTPGDIGDKLIAGSTQFLGGGLGGLATARLAKGLKAGPGLETIADFAGSYAGDFAAIPVGDALQRSKDKVMGGEGRTAYERMSDEQQQQFADQIRQQTLMGAGLIPGVQDQYTGGFGLS